MKRLIGLILVTLLVWCPSVTFAISVNRLPGTIQEDGSYQLSPEERQRLINLREQLKEKNKEISLMEMISIVSPSYYETLKFSTKESLNKLNWNYAQQESGNYELNVYPGLTSTIGRYGYSLKGYSLTDWHRDMEILWIENYLVNDDTEVVVGCSWGIAFNTNRVSATTIVDPPSGTYYSQGVHEVEGWCPYHEDVIYRLPSWSDRMYYYNPYDYMIYYNQY